MPKYTFTFKKGNIFVEFTTDDKIIVAKQFPKWVEAADEYKRQHPTQAAEKKNPTPVVEETGNRKQKTEDVKTQRSKEAEQIESLSTSQHLNPSTPSQPFNQEEEPATIRSLIEEPIAEIVDEISEHATEVFDKASTLLKTINSIQNPEPETVKEPETVNFEKVLEKSIENPTFEPNKRTDEKFLELVNSKNPQSKFQRFIIAAYYLLEYEKMERFSLKQINAKLMQNLSEIIDHTVLQEAFNRGFVEFVPDLTGLAEIAEYRLTDAGEEYFVNGF